MNPNKLFISLGILSLFFILGIFPAFAQPITNPPLTISDTISPTLSNQHPSVTLGKRPPPRSPSTKPTKQEIIARIALHTKEMLTRSNNALTRLDAIWERVKSRIEKFKTSGKDVTGIAGLIQQVDIKKQAASNAISSASASISKIESSSAPKTAAKNFVTSFRTVKKALKDYHQAILKVITSLKGMSASTKDGPSVIPPTGTSSTTIAPSAIPSIQNPSPTLTVTPL